MRPINKFFTDLPVTYDDISKLRFAFSRLPSSFFSFDVTDGYHHIAVDPEYRQYFQYNVNGECFECNSLQFGYNQAPHYFVKCFGLLMDYIKDPASFPAFAYTPQLLGYDYVVYVYMDDILFLSYESDERTQQLIELLQ